VSADRDQLKRAAALRAIEEVPPEIPRVLLRGLDLGTQARNEISVIRVRPAGEFVTYGVGVSLPVMRRPEAASGRAAV